MQINWYPGHMAKAKRQLQDQLSRVDAVIELCDARLPYASRNPDLNYMTKNKARVLLMNKADLADPSVTQQWTNYFKSRGLQCAAVTAERNAKEVLKIIEKLTREKVERAEARGVRKTIRVMVVGVPNVGKSTLINRLHGGAIAKVGDRPGVTRANQWVRVGEYLELLDTPGMLWPRLDDPIAAKRLAYISAIKDEILDTYALAVSLLEDLIVMSPEAVQKRYKLTDLSLRGLELMEAVCRGRGFLLRGGELDIDRACAVVLDEFRDGKLGRVTLETPASLKKPETKEEKAEEKDGTDGQA
ncbi:MAG: ribosome biogenesis GTPase YlqF [Clostridia bacterium]|nr:ribosome biogenesis GTPase YlqF [Clostridia bacterium]